MKNYLIFFTLIFLSFGILGCAKYPEGELMQAEQAVADAHSAGAKIYAPEEFGSARLLFEGAQKSIEEKDFAKAKEKALEAIKLAESARKISQNQKNKLKMGMEKTLVELKAMINSITPSDSMSAKKIDVAKELANDAEAAFNSGDFNKAKQKMDATKFLLEELPAFSAPVTEKKTQPQENAKEVTEETETKNNEKSEENN